MLGRGILMLHYRHRQGIIDLVVDAVMVLVMDVVIDI